MVTATSTAGFKAMWNRLQVPWKNAGNERFWFHDLRAKAVTDLKEQGRDAKEVILEGRCGSRLPSH
jgi:hypothetical protein